MSTDAELAAKRSKDASYRRSIDSYNRKINTEENRINNLEDEIYRLKNAYNRLDNLENGAAKELKDKTKVKTATGGYKWRGENKDKFDNMFDGEIYPDAKDLKDYIDGLKDSINWKIQEKQSEIYKSQGLIGSFKSSINWFKTAIVNLWN